MMPTPMPPNMLIDTSVFDDFFGGLMPIVILICFFWLGWWFVSKVHHAIYVPMTEKSHLIKQTGDNTYTYVGEYDKPKNDDKRKNDDRVGFDPFEESDGPAYTIGDDGELVEVDRE